MRKVINISLPGPLYREVERTVKRRGFSTKSEMFRALFRAWKEGQIPEEPPRFRTKEFLARVRRHWTTKGPSDLSKNHDKYLYGD